MINYRKKYIKYKLKYNNLKEKILVQIQRTK